MKRKEVRGQNLEEIGAFKAWNEGRTPLRQMRRNGRRKTRRTQGQEASKERILPLLPGSQVSFRLTVVTLTGGGARRG